MYTWMVSTDDKLTHQKIATKQLPPLRWMSKKHGLPSVDLPASNQRRTVGTTVVKNRKYVVLHYFGGSTISKRAYVVLPEFTWS
jgi:hypothetical protein